MPLFCLTYNGNHALQVGSLRDIQEDGVVLGLATDLENPEGAMSIEGGRGEHFQEVGLAHVVGAGAGHEEASGTEHLEGAEVEFFVAAKGGVEVALAFGEGGRIENDGIVAAFRGVVVLHQIKGVGLDPFNFFVRETGAVEGGILVCDLEGGPGAIDASDLRTVGGEVEREAALITKNVEGFAFGVVGGSVVVFALVEEGSGFLAFEGIVVKLDAVHGEGGRGLVTLYESGVARRQSFEIAD